MLTKPVYKFEGIYECDSQGNVYSCLYNLGSKRTKLYKIKAYNSFGYMQVELHRNKKRYKVFVSRIICSAFHGNAPSAKHVVEHINGDINDNRASNLRWQKGTGEMVKRSYTKAKWNEDPNINKHTKLTLEKVSEIVEILNKPDHPSLREMAHRYNVTRGHIANIKAGRVWKELTGGEV